MKATTKRSDRYLTGMMVEKTDSGFARVLEMTVEDHKRVLRPVGYFENEQEAERVLAVRELLKEGAA